MSNLTVRILTAVIAGTAVVAGIWFSPWGLFIFCMALSILGILEFYKITGVKWWPAYVVAGLLALVVWGGLGLGLASELGLVDIWASPSLVIRELLFLLWSGSPVYHGLILWLVLMFILAMASLFRKANPDPVKEIALWGMGYFYAFLPFVIFFSLHLGAFTPPPSDHDAAAFRSYLQREGLISEREFWDTAEYQAAAEELEVPQQQTDSAPRRYYEYQEGDSVALPPYRYMALGILFLFWALDSFAYFGGRLFGKHKLFERISPKKTWEGSLIGAAFCIGLGVLFQFVWPVGWNWIVVAAIISVTGQLGDLVESMFKRSLALKDSGGLLPGHGGILDRFDGFILSMPFIALYHLFTQWF